MSTAATLATLGLAGSCLLVVSACVGDGAWYTPAGLPLGKIDCTSPAPLSGPMGREICLGRVIEETPEAITQCEKDGGKVGPVSTIDRRFACSYRKVGQAGGQT